MSKVVQISILGKIYGNVNADEVIGTRVTLKKMYNSEGEVLPFVSARAIKYAIRKALEEKGFKIDPFKAEGQQLNDSGDPEKYIDNDLFGYMKTERGERRGKGGSKSRQAPIAISYFKALRDTPISTEFAARFPREDKNKEGKDLNPVPFEIEVAEFVGRLNCLIYDYIGKVKDKNKEENFNLSEDERKIRLKSFLEVFLTPSYVLPRRTNSLNIPEYLIGVVFLSDDGPKPIYSYLDYIKDEAKIKVDVDKLRRFVKFIKNGSSDFFLIDYGIIETDNLKEEFKISSVEKAIERIEKFYFSKNKK